MTEAETRTILKTLQNAYPSRYRNMAKADAAELVRQWSALEPFDDVKAAVNNWLLSQRFHPTVADIRGIMTPSDGGDDMRSAFISTLRFRISQLKRQIKPAAKLEPEAERQQSVAAQRELNDIYAKYGHFLEDKT